MTSMINANRLCPFILSIASTGAVFTAVSKPIEIGAGDILVNRSGKPNTGDVEFVTEGFAPRNFRHHR